MVSKNKISFLQLVLIVAFLLAMVIKYLLLQLIPVLFLLSISWVFLLRREIARKTESLQSEILERKNVEGRLYNAMILWRKGWVLIAFMALSGCAAYAPRPITADAVQAKLPTPDMAELRILASEISHPILKPVDMRPDQGLYPDGAAVLAVMLNPSLRAIRDQRLLSSAQLLDAGLLPNPELSYSLEMPIGSDTAGRINAYGLGLSWEVTSLIARGAKTGRAKKSKEAVDLDIAWQEWQVAQAAKAAVYQLAALQNLSAQAEQACLLLGQNLADIQRALAVGDLTVKALNTAQAANSQANANLLDLKKQADQQRLQLMRLIGLPTDTQIRLGKGVELPSQVELPTYATLLEGLEQRRLDLVGLRRGYESQEAAVRVAILEQMPRITIGPTMSRDSDSMRAAGFGLNIELPIFNRNQGKIAIERATRQKLLDEYVNRIFEAQSDIKMLLSDIRFTNKQIAAAQASEVNLGGLVENYRVALTDGRIDALLYYTARKDLVSARMKVFSLKGQLARAVVALELVTGFYEIPQPVQALVNASTTLKGENTP
jgi:cobalt-zinc-cadmium efflux system outer membrane protein